MEADSIRNAYQKIEIEHGIPAATFAKRIITMFGHIQGDGLLAGLVVVKMFERGEIALYQENEFTLSMKDKILLQQVKDSSGKTTEAKFGFIDSDGTPKFTDSPSDLEVPGYTSLTTNILDIARMYHSAIIPNRPFKLQEVNGWRMNYPISRTAQFLSDHLENRELNKIS